MKKNNYYLYRALRFIGKPLFHILFRPKIVNRIDNIDGEPIIFCGNHKSYLDPLLLIISTKKVVHFLAKKEIFKGMFKGFFYSVGCIPVNRKIKDKNAVETALTVLNNNDVIGIFPEGTRNKKQELLPFKYGAVSMASKTNAWVVPFGISGQYNVFRNNLTITFGKPYKIKDDLETENKRLMKKVNDLKNKENYEK